MAPCLLYLLNRAYMCRPDFSLLLHLDRLTHQCPGRHGPQALRICGRVATHHVPHHQVSLQTIQAVRASSATATLLDMGAYARVR